MAVLYLRGLWMHEATDLSDYVILPLAPGWSQQPVVAGGTRQMANGRNRVIRGRGRKRTLTPQLMRCSVDLVEQVEARAGRTQQFRSSTGLVMYGVYFAPKITWLGTPDGEPVARVQFEVAEVTVS